MVKENSILWDATAGNRTIWITKDDPRILWTDIEEELSFKPDRILDCRHTDFPDKSKAVIWFDPPHSWGRIKNETMFTTPNREVHNEKWTRWKRNGHPRYYGFDKYETMDKLKEFISDSGREFHRVLRDDGILMVKWSESAFPLPDLLALFSGWQLLIKIRIGGKKESLKPSFWLILDKNMGKVTENDRKSLKNSQK